MKKSAQNLVAVSREIMRDRHYRAILLVLVAVFALLLFLLPVWIVPGNTIAVQWRLFGLVDYGLLLLIASLQGLLVTLLLYRSRRKTASPRGFSAHLGVLSGVPAFLFGAKLCPMCIAVLLGGFGPGAVVFAIEERFWIFAASVAVLVVSLLLAARSISACGGCCGVRPR